MLDFICNIDSFTEKYTFTHDCVQNIPLLLFVFSYYGF